MFRPLKSYLFAICTVSRAWLSVKHTWNWIFFPPLDRSEPHTHTKINGLQNFWSLDMVFFIYHCLHTDVVFRFHSSTRAISQIRLFIAARKVCVCVCMRNYKNAPDITGMIGSVHACTTGVRTTWQHVLLCNCHVFVSINNLSVAGFGLRRAWQLPVSLGLAARRACVGL